MPCFWFVGWGKRQHSWNRNVNSNLNRTHSKSENYNRYTIIRRLKGHFYDHYMAGVVSTLQKQEKRHFMVQWHPFSQSCLSSITFAWIYYLGCQNFILELPCSKAGCREYGCSIHRPAETEIFRGSLGYKEGLDMHLTWLAVKKWRISLIVASLFPYSAI